jgi:membrane-bound lytic murein transglycosylase D
LPKETQGYVPNFIAAAYMLTYHAEHNIIPMEAKTHNAQLDTICLKKGVHMESVALLANWDLSEIKEFNPIYKTTFIPKSEKGRCLSGPLDKIYLVIHLEDSLYAIEKQKYGRYVAPIPPPKVLDTLIKKDSIKNIVPINEYQYYTVKAGDKINVIAQTYKVTIDELTEWNKLSSPNLYVGQSITIKKAAAPAPKPVVPPKPVVTPKPPKPTPPPPPQKKYYSVKSGDNFSQVARKNNLTFEELKKLNPGINVNTVYIGQKLRIK